MINKPTNAKMVSELRAYAKARGLTFRKANHTVNNLTAYCFTDRKTGKIVLNNCTLVATYTDALWGDLSEILVAKGYQAK